MMLRLSGKSNNGTVCTVERDGRPGVAQIITFTEKLTNLKYELLMAYFGRDIQFLNYVYSVTGVKDQRSKVKH
jgi:hypothetical protein